MLNGTPADCVNILREANVKSMTNPELPAEAKKSRMEIEPVTVNSYKHRRKES
jgi:hypothetical protein